jgi:hypothetical protein
MKGYNASRKWDNKLAHITRLLENKESKEKINMYRYARNRVILNALIHQKEFTYLNYH